MELGFYGWRKWVGRKRNDISDWNTKGIEVKDEKEEEERILKGEWIVIVASEREFANAVEEGWVSYYVIIYQDVRQPLKLWLILNTVGIFFSFFCFSLMKEW